MSLTSLFNFGYLKENIKKSKAIILLCVFLIPIINGIVLLMNCSSGSFMPSMDELSGFIILGMYFIPVVLAITLFNFIYKRGSIDFVLSMPINKKEIFLTNTLGGILVILLMQVVNFIISLVICLIYSNLIVDYKMLFDILVLYFIAYVFVFVCTNVAISVSSNRITTVVVTLLILFLIPFISTFISTNGFSYNISDNARVECISDECKPSVYYCDDVNCEINKKKNVYSAYISKIDDITYTLPYEFINDNVFAIESDSNMVVSIIKMVILSIVYIFVGVSLFVRKGFEVVGTSFRSERVHVLVRTLTTVPIMCVFYLIVKNLSISSYDFFSIILLLVLIFAYLIIYDLITRRKVTNFFKMMICLVIVFLSFVICDSLLSDDSYNINVNDVKEISFIDGYDSLIGTSENRDVINYIMSLLLDSESLGDVYYTYHIKVYTNDGIYRFNVYATRDNYDYINGILSGDKEFVSSYDRGKDTRVFGIGYKDNYTRVSGENNLSSMIINRYKSNKSLFEISDGDSLFDISLYTYNDFDVGTVTFNVGNDKELALGLLRYYNANTRLYFNERFDISDIYSCYIDDRYYGYSYDEIVKFIALHIDDDIDISKEYSYIKLYGKYGIYIFATNDILELNDIVSSDNVLDYDDVQGGRV